MEAQNTGTLKCEHVIVQADECISPPERYYFNIDMIKDDEISIKCKLDDILYRFNIIENEKWWQENKQLFQQSFNEFSDILVSALTNRSPDFEIMITNKYINNLNVTIKYQSPYFKFQILFKLVKEPSLEDKIEKLQSEMKDLQADNIELHREIKEIRKEQEQEHYPDWQLLKKTDTYPGENIETMACKTDLNILQCKAYCIQKEYGAFVTNGQTAFFRNYSRKECLEKVCKSSTYNTYIAPTRNIKYGKGMLVDGFHGLFSNSLNTHIFSYYKKDDSKLPNPLFETHCEPDTYCSNCRFVKNHTADIDTYECLGHN
jgi:hypothetical protein